MDKNLVFTKKLITTAAFLLIVFFVVNGLASNNTGDEGLDSDEYFIKPVSFESTVLSRGTIKPAMVIPIKSQIAGAKSKLVWAMADGQYADKGDVIARFDTTKYEEDLIRSEQTMEDAKATLMAAEKALVLQREEEVKKKENASRRLDIARLQARDLLKGSGQLLKERLQLELEQARRSLAIAEAELVDYEVLLAKGHVSQREREKASDSARKFEELKNLKAKELANYNQYQWPKIKREAEILAEQAEADYLRTLRVSELELQKRKNDQIKSSRDLERAQKQRDLIKQNITACNVITPISGQLYHTILPRSDGPRKIQIGDTIWAGQTFMEIPDTNQFILESFVREFDVADVKVGQRVKVSLDAFPRKKISGTVDLVSHVIDDEREVSQFKVISLLTDDLNGIHLGMSGTATITTMSYENILAVPLKYIQFIDNQPFIDVIYDDQVITKRVTLAGANNDWQVISEGVNEGDIVVQ